MVAKIQNKVVEFLERDDNSRNMPGKGDCVKSDTGEKSQVRVLTDHLSTLYMKFMNENPYQIVIHLFHQNQTSIYTPYIIDNKRHMSLHKTPKYVSEPENTQNC